MTTENIVDLFLCHASPDKEWVKSLAEQFESETFDGQPEGRTLRTFLDEWDIQPGASFFDRMAEGLARARYVAVVLSPALLRAQFASLEWQHVLAEDPTNRRRRLLPLLYRATEEGGDRISLPPPFRVLNWIDFSEEGLFKRSFQKMVRVVRDLPPERGKMRKPLAGVSRPAAPLPTMTALAPGPDQVNEVIISNLLPVQRFPATIWSASTSAVGAKDVYDVVQDAPPFEIQGKRLYTVADLSVADTKFAPVIDRKTISSEPISAWRPDPVRRRWLVSLFNRAIRKHLGRMAIWFNKDHRVFFFPGPGGNDRTHRNGRDRTRKVAAKHRKYGTDLFFWVHHAAELSVRLIGDEFYVMVVPTYGVSIDGKLLTKAEWVGDVKRAWGGKERNAAILRHVVFWGRTLSRGAPSASVATGGGDLVVSAIPALAATDFGIETDSVRIRALLEDDRDDLAEAAKVLGMEDATQET